jgi:DNA-binding MarR family transcriptional regulator
VEGVKAETLPALLPELFRGIYEGGLLDTEIESLFLTFKKKTGVSVAALRKDWTRYRATREEEERKVAAPVLGGEDRAAAQELSQDPALLHRAIRALGDLGIVGEEENRGLLYLALLSAKMANPISVLVKGRSSSGKSFLVKTVLTLIPPRGYYELSSMSTKALVYADLDFTHRHLVLYEEDGLNNEEVLYLVRTLLSEGEIRYLTVEKTPQGKMAAREIHRPGPTGLITTLTKGLTKEDNETRTFSLYMDDSKDHTLRVVHALAVRESVGVRPEVEVAPWHALYEALPHVEVVVPFAPAIARLLDAKDLPEDQTRLRRDFGRFLTLVKVVALLHHARREERGGHIVATLEDYALAYHLAARPMARSVHTVSPQALTLAVAVREVYEDKLAKGDAPEGVRVYVKELARRLRWATRTVQKWVDMADAAGLVEVQKDGTRLALRPVEGAPLEESSFRLLPEPERLARELGEGGRYVHPITGETCVLYLPESACELPSKTEENNVQDEENQRARYAHGRARTPEEHAPGEGKTRAHSEVPSSSQNSEVRARYAHASTPTTEEEVEVEVDL